MAAIYVRAVFAIGISMMSVLSCYSKSENASLLTSPGLTETPVSKNTEQSPRHRGLSMEIDVLENSGLDYLGWALDDDIFAYGVRNVEYPTMLNNVYFSDLKNHKRCQLEGQFEFSSRIGRPQPFQWLPNGIVVATTTEGVTFSGRPCDDVGFVQDNRDPGTCELRTMQLSPRGTFTAITEQLSSRDGIVSMRSSITDSGSNQLMSSINWTMPEMINSVCNAEFFTDWIGESRYLIGRSIMPGPLILSASGEVSPLVEQAWAQQVTGDSLDSIAVSGVAIGSSGDYALLLRDMQSQLVIMYRSNDDSTEEISQNADIAEFSPNGKWLAVGYNGNDSTRRSIELIATERGGDNLGLLSQQVGRVKRLSWSPTSDMVAIEVDKHKSDGVYLFEIDSVNGLLVETDVFDRAASIGRTPWSPSGHIFQIVDRDSDVIVSYMIKRRQQKQ
jgi:hypothetical protein